MDKTQQIEQLQRENARLREELRVLKVQEVPALKPKQGDFKAGKVTASAPLEVATINSNAVAKAVAKAEAMNDANS